MDITIADLKFFQSQRMTDNADGGGRMTNVEIVDGASNQIHDDLSDVDRASGDVSIRKAFAAVTSANTSKYLDAGLAIFAPPADPNTSVLAFTTGDHYDERADLADAIGQFRARGIDTKLRLIGTHLPNQRVLYGYMLKPVSKSPQSLFFNATLSVAAETSGTITAEQFVKVMRVTAADATYVYLVNNVQTTYEVVEVTLDLTTPLEHTFQSAAENASGAYTPPTIVRTTNPVAPFQFAGATTLASNAAQNDKVLTLEDTKARVVPLDYQDLGQNEQIIPRATIGIYPETVARVQSFAAPDGFSLPVTLSPAPAASYIAGNPAVFYQYGGEWIGPDDPNAGTLYESTNTIAFPLRPDIGSTVVLEWYRRHPEQYEGYWTGTAFTLLVPGPIIAGSVIVGANAADDNALIVSTADNGSGALSGNSVTGTADYVTGIVTATFPEAVKSETFFVRYNLGGFFPQPTALLGIDSMRLPADGRLAIFGENQLALIHHTATFSEAALTAGEVVNCGRGDLYRVAIRDAAGRRVNPNLYEVNRPAGTFTMENPLDLTGYTAPFTVHHTIASLHRINRVSHSQKTLTLTRGIPRAFVADDTRVSSVLFFGTLQARYGNLFSQTTWTGVWSDSRIGDAPLAQYNDALYPIEISNLGAYKDRILVRFTSATAFQVIGERLGVIGIGTINEDCSPFNSLTGQPYFTIDYRGWGAGWATGNCLRFSVEGANAPFALVRAIQPSAPTALDDSVELLFLGNVDA